jgi:hypothetical protein
LGRYQAHPCTLQSGKCERQPVQRCMQHQRSASGVLCCLLLLTTAALAGWLSTPSSAFELRSLHTWVVSGHLTAGRYAAVEKGIMKVSRTPWSSDLDIHVPEYGDIAVSTRISSAATKQAAEAAFISSKVS